VGMFTQQSINVTFLGTGCDYSYPENEPVCILVERTNLRILLECCPRILAQLTSVNREPTEIQAVLISHLHVGHFLGLPSLIFGNLPKGRNEKLTIIVPNETKNKVLSVIEWTVEGIGGEGLMRIPERPFRIEILEASSSDLSTFTIDSDVTMTTVPVKHTARSLGCALEFRKQGMKIVYSGDTKPCKDIKKLASNADLLIHDAFFESGAKEWAEARGHSTIKEAAEIAEEANAKVLALVHFHWTRYRRKNFVEKAITEAKEVFGGEIIVPHDLESIDLLSYHTKPFTSSIG